MRAFLKSLIENLKRPEDRKKFMKKQHVEKTQVHAAFLVAPQCFSTQRCLHFSHFKKSIRDLPGHPVVKKDSALLKQGCRSPGQRTKTPPAVQQGQKIKLKTPPPPKDGRKMNEIKRNISSASFLKS